MQKETILVDENEETAFTKPLCYVLIPFTMVCARPFMMILPVSKQISVLITAIMPAS